MLIPAEIAERIDDVSDDVSDDDIVDADRRVGELTDLIVSITRLLGSDAP